ncbi:DNA helicase RecQ [Galbibacter mesophilus]|uniref:DNA helicase RecQ n=1 Tax=Galbibacter mesophilus TaxID=379069 RepID=UPI00191E712F|nr:DNA helicase RecQ [Galbibacter mesophilus]MCM5663551.1 DNA helicase RecQ [Galbibacter mesophilus]
MIQDTAIYNTLKEYFGYDSFRSHQKEIIENVLKGNDCLVVMPTGGGKSICYQLPAMLMDGLTIVVSPLIALMKDQVDGLQVNGISANYFNSSQTAAEHEAIFKAVENKETKLLYVAPESLSYLENIFSSVNVSLIAIDEAHCISSWGHDFRPAYTQLGYLKNRFPNTPLIALTATADKATREDIAQQLNIPHAKKYIASFDRKNISLEVRPGTERLQQITRFLNKRPNESGIIYCLSRKATENLAEKLQKAGFNAQAYHAGLNNNERSQTQEDFINDKIDIVCATIAFGMGIDKSNVRWVIHYNMPKNLEGYYQEIGRAGRDGLPSATLLFHSYADVVQLQQFAEGAGNAEVQIAKLERMKQYADALSCRRKILLSYFGEFLEEDCGNCDVCKNPPQFFNGTILAQKALSCVARLKEQENIGMVIDVLRGAHNQQVLEKNYQQIKTYGIANDISWRDWQHYIVQMVNLGYLEIAFHQKNALKLTPQAKDVLFNNQEVALTKPQEKVTVTPTEVKEKKKTKNSLFERLRQLRLDIAREEDIPAYLIFNDATLKEIEAERPITDDDFMRINGVGKRKMETYGYQFIKEIIAFNKEKETKKSRKKGATHLETFRLYQEGLSVEEIAKTRKLSATTIYSHISKLYQDGKDIDLMQFVDADDLKAVKEARKMLDNPDQLKPYYEHFEEAIDYWTIRLCLTLLGNDKSS